MGDIASLVLDKVRDQADGLSALGVRILLCRFHPNGVVTKKMLHITGERIHGRQFYHLKLLNPEFAGEAELVCTKPALTSLITAFSDPRAQTARVTLFFREYPVSPGLPTVGVDQLMAVGELAPLDWDDPPTESPCPAILIIEPKGVVDLLSFVCNVLTATTKK